MNQYKSGFTIVELLITVVVLAILAIVTILASRGMQSRTYETALQSDLSRAAEQMEDKKAKNGAYPKILPAEAIVTNENVLSLSESSKGFCINGHHSKRDSLRMRYESGVGLKIGLCSGAVVSGSEVGQNPNLITNTDFSGGWQLNTTANADRTLIARDGTSEDPFPGRPVLVLSNDSAAVTEWAALHSVGVNTGAIERGKTYIGSYYVRNVGNYGGTLPSFGIVNVDNTNASVEVGSWAAPPSTWRKVSQAHRAVASGVGTNQLYLPLDATSFTTPGWQLEFQGFELREQ